MDWNTYYNKQYASTINADRCISNAGKWRMHLANKILSHSNNGKVLEAGCGLGLTSLLLGPQMNRTLLDIEDIALNRAKDIFTSANQEANFILGSLFDLELSDKTFDIVFNSGVLEHFSFGERVIALREMARVTKENGVLVVAVPNHFSVPYRDAYGELKRKGEWPYPDERKIYDFEEEIEHIGEIFQLSRETFDIDNSFNFIKDRIAKLIYKLKNTVMNYEGYLTVITLRRK